MMELQGVSAVALLGAGGELAEYALGHVTRLLGSQMQVDVSDKTIKQYQSPA